VEIRRKISIALSASGLAGAVLFSTGLHAQTFETLKASDCLTSVSGLFTTGGQYVDPNNGVLNNSWSMLVRWQGSTFVNNTVSYAVGAYTGFYPPSPAATWQRGVQPESSYYGTPAVQLNCTTDGMFINTWWVPHQIVVGGGYNDMFGYQWASGYEPRPFYTYVGYTYTPTDLIVQSNIAVTEYGPYTPNGSTQCSPSTQCAHGQVSIFAYVIDKAHPLLHPIAIVMQTHDDQSATNPGSIGCDYPTGVWFASLDAQTPNAYHTVDPYSTPSQKITAFQNASAPWQFYRMRISPTNMANIASAINASALNCPAKGYSTFASDYVLKYAGVIEEAALFGDINTNTLNNPNIAQVSLAAKFDGVSMYRRY
jgi:hypothetical protein